LVDAERQTWCQRAASNREIPRNRGASRKSLHAALDAKVPVDLNDRTIEEKSMLVDTKLRAHFRTSRSGSHNELRDVIDWGIKLIVAMLSAPRGDQGGWEAGARGL
jgi:hypothetical protein